MADPTYYSREQAQARLGVDAAALAELVRDGRLTELTVDGSTAFNREQVEALFASLELGSGTPISPPPAAPPRKPRAERKKKAEPLLDMFGAGEPTPAAPAPAAPPPEKTEALVIPEAAGSDELGLSESVGFAVPESPTMSPDGPADAPPAPAPNPESDSGLTAGIGFGDVPPPPPAVDPAQLAAGQPLDLPASDGLSDPVSGVELGLGESVGFVDPRDSTSPAELVRAAMQDDAPDGSAELGLSESVGFDKGSDQDSSDDLPPLAHMITPKPESLEASYGEPGLGTLPKPAKPLASTPAPVLGRGLSAVPPGGAGERSSGAPPRPSGSSRLEQAWAAMKPVESAPAQGQPAQPPAGVAPVESKGAAGGLPTTTQPVAVVPAGRAKLSPPVAGTPTPPGAGGSPILPTDRPRPMPLVQTSPARTSAVQPGLDAPPPAPRGSAPLVAPPAAPPPPLGPPPAAVRPAPTPTTPAAAAAPKPATPAQPKPAPGAVAAQIKQVAEQIEALHAQIRQLRLWAWSATLASVLMLALLFATRPPHAAPAGPPTPAATR